MLFLYCFCNWYTTDNSQKDNIAIINAQWDCLEVGHCLSYSPKTEKQSSYRRIIITCIITLTLSFTGSHFETKVNKNLRKCLINENTHVLTESFLRQQSYCGYTFCYLGSRIPINMSAAWVLNNCHGSMIHEVLFQAGIILFPVESLGEMGASPCIIFLGDSFIV